MGFECRVTHSCRSSQLVLTMFGELHDRPRLILLFFLGLAVEHVAFPCLLVLWSAFWRLSLTISCVRVRTESYPAARIAQLISKMLFLLGTGVPIIVLHRLASMLSPVGAPSWLPRSQLSRLADAMVAAAQRSFFCTSLFFILALPYAT